MAANRIFALAVLTGASLFPAAALRAQSSGEAATVFGQPMSPRYLVNRLAGPAPQEVSGGAGGAQGGAIEREEDDGPGPFPRRYLFNKLFDSGAAPEGAAKTP